MAQMDPIEQSRRNWESHANGRVDQVAAATALTRARQLGAARAGSRIAPLSLTFAQLEVLAVLCRPDPPSSLAELSRELSLHATTVARTVTRLTRHGYVERAADEVDKRAVVISVTPTGRAAATAALTDLRTINFGLMGWSVEDSARFTELVEPIIRDTPVENAGR